MNQAQLSRQAVARLLAAPVKVKVWNGNFKSASVEAKFSRYSLELRVSKSNPTLEWASGLVNEVSLVYWKSNQGSPMPVPAELNSLVKKLQEAASMSPEEALKLNREMYQAVSSFYANFS